MGLDLLVAPHNLFLNQQLVENTAEEKVTLRLNFKNIFKNETNIPKPGEIFEYTENHITIYNVNINYFKTT